MTPYDDLRRLADAAPPSLAPGMTYRDFMAARDFYRAARREMPALLDELARLRAAIDSAANLIEVADGRRLTLAFVVGRLRAALEVQHGAE